MGDEHLGILGHVGCLNSVHLARTSVGRKDGKDATASANVQHDLRKSTRVLGDSGDIVL